MANAKLLFCILASPCLLAPSTRAQSNTPLFLEPLLESGVAPSAVEVADVNRDGRPDLASANAESNSITVQISRGSGRFWDPVSYSVGATPAGLAAGDVNGDGLADLVTADARSNSVSVAENNGSGWSYTVTSYPTGVAPRAVAIGDVDADGIPDLVTANSGSNDASVLRGLGGGAFGAPVNFAAGQTPHALALADFNSDGALDLAVANLGSNDVSVLLGNGAGGFASAITFGAGFGPRSIAAADLNDDGDGNLDVALACEGSDDVFVLRGDGAGGLAFAFALPVGSRPPEVVLGDFNSDGRLDFASVNRDSNDVSVAINAGPGALWSVSSYPIGGSASALTASDLDVDGLLDLAVASFDESRPAVVVLPGRAQGSFAAAKRYRVGSLPVDVLAGDLNGDGRTDLVAASSALNRLDLLLNQSRTGPETYCTAGISTNGCSALLSSTGAPSASNAQPFVVQVSGMDAGRSTVMFIGANGSTGIPWSSTSSSSVCVRAPIQRAAFGNSGGTAGACDGAFAFDLNAYLVTNPVIGGTPVIAGASLNVQAWFRDGSAPRGSNLSNAMELLVGP